jgi:LMBR1-like membrane protein
MSLIVVEGESTLFIDATASLFGFLFQYEYDEIQTQLLCMCPLVYILLSIYIPLFQLKLKGRYGLYKHNHTDPANLIWSACFMARLIPAISYNFTLLTKVNKTQFRDVMKVADFSKVGTRFLELYPLLLIVLCLLNAFNVLSRLLKSVGLSQFSLSDTLDIERIAEGKALIGKARLEKERAIRETKNYSVRIIKESDLKKSAKEPLIQKLK